MRLYGKNPVIERLKADPQSVKKIYLQTGHEDAGYVYRKAKKWGIPVHAVPKSKVQKLARNLNAQGILAEIGTFPYAAYDDLLENALKHQRTVVFLDGLTDPQNLGGIIRSLACLGGFALVLPTHRSVEVTESVLRVACGGENHIEIAKVSNLNRAIAEARDRGFWAAGTVVKDGEPLTDVKFNYPLALVVGSEQKGIRDVVKKNLDLLVTLPMGQPRMSMNAAHAAAVFCYEAYRQKQGTAL